MRVKRVVVSCLLTGALLAAFAGGAGAAANTENANCLGQVASAGLYPGPVRAAAAREAGGLGQFAGPAASSNCGTR